MVKSALPRGLSIEVIAWHAVQVMLAAPSGSAATSYSGSSHFGCSNAPVKNGTGSWQPAQKRATSTLLRRVSRTLAA